MESTYLYVKRELRKHSGDYPTIAKEAKVSYSWLSKLATGAIPNPGSLQIDRLAKVLRKRTEARA